MQLKLASRSDVGRVRKNNEDSFFADAELGLFIVCDGMGGHKAGEVASKTTCEVVKAEILAAKGLRDKFIQSAKYADLKALRKTVESAVISACKEVHKRSVRDPETSGMGTTATMLLLAGHGKGILAHVGDSRLFVLRNGSVHQLSEDHTYVNELVKRGALTPEQARNHPHGNVLSRAIGVQPSVSVDTMVFDIDPGDTYLLCSDGLYNYYPDSAEIAALLALPDLELAVEGLTNGALERGGHDNCTSVVLRIDNVATTAEESLAADYRIGLLKRIPIFAHLTYNELVRVVGVTHLTRAAGGTFFIREGQTGDELYVVLSGEVQVSKGEQILATLRAGAHLGEMAMIDNAPRSASVRAVTDANLLAMRREEFFGLIRSEPVIGTKLLWSFVNVLSGRLRQTNEALQGARQELAHSIPNFEIFVDGEKH